MPDATFQPGDSLALYSKNIVQEKDTTESVNRESIADLSSTRSHWEQFLKKPTSPEPSPAKPSKSTVRHWDVQTKYKPASVEPPINTKTEEVPASEPISLNVQFGESTTITDDMDPYSNESAIEREIRLAMERENMLKREQNERLELQTRQKGISMNEPPANTTDNEFKPTYHEMTEADRGSEMSQRESVIRQEIEDLKLREQALPRAEESDDVSKS